MARDLQEVEVTTASGLKTTYRVSSDDRERYRRMSKQNEERLKRREQRAEEGAKRGEETKVRQPRRASGDVEIK